MVLTLKRWKSRSPPGIEASGSGYNPFTKSTGLTRKGGPFGVFGPGSRRKVGIAGWSSPVARQAHNLKVVGSNPTPATNLGKRRYQSCADILITKSQITLSMVSTWHHSPSEVWWASAVIGLTVHLLDQRPIPGLWICSA